MLMEDILNSLNEIVFITNIEDYTLQYVNKAGLDICKYSGEAIGEKCYKVIHKRNEPCPSCNSSILTDDFIHWKECYDNLGYTFLRKAKRITWNGQPCRLEISSDVSDLVINSNRLASMLEMETFTIECARILNSSEDYPAAISLVLEKMGKRFEADRAYIFEAMDGIMSNTYEWCAIGISPEKDWLQNLRISDYQDFWDWVSQPDGYFLDDVEKVRDDKLLYETLTSQNVHSLIVHPLYDNRNMLGYIGLDNLPLKTVEGIRGLFSSLSYFVSSIIRKSRYLAKLEELSFRDSLTGLYNRNSYIMDLERDQILNNVGIAFVDLNGLKWLNDNLGHKEGDKALKNAASIISQVFHMGKTYRIGGDEFVAICQNLAKDDFMALSQKLRTAGREKGCDFAAGFRWVETVRDLETLVNETDKAMYEDKEKIKSRKANNPLV